MASKKSKGATAGRAPSAASSASSSAVHGAGRRKRAVTPAPLEVPEKDCQGEPPPADGELGSCITLGLHIWRVRYVGPVFHADGEFVGLELVGPSPTPVHASLLPAEVLAPTTDGSVDGTAYFSCPPRRGLFLRQAQVEEELLAQRQCGDGSNRGISARRAAGPSVVGSVSSLLDRRRSAPPQSHAQTADEELAGWSVPDADHIDVPREGVLKGLAWEDSPPPKGPSRSPQPVRGVKRSPALCDSGCQTESVTRGNSATTATAAQTDGLDLPGPAVDADAVRSGAAECEKIIHRLDLALHKFSRTVAQFELDGGLNDLSSPARCGAAAGQEEESTVSAADIWSAWGKGVTERIFSSLSSCRPLLPVVQSEISRCLDDHAASSPPTFPTVWAKNSRSRACLEESLAAALHTLASIGDAIPIVAEMVSTDIGESAVAIPPTDGAENDAPEGVCERFRSTLCAGQEAIRRHLFDAQERTQRALVAAEEGDVVQCEQLGRAKVALLQDAQRIVPSLLETLPPVVAQFVDTPRREVQLAGRKANRDFTDLLQHIKTEALPNVASKICALNEEIQREFDEFSIAHLRLATERKEAHQQLRSGEKALASGLEKILTGMAEITEASNQILALKGKLIELQGKKNNLEMAHCDADNALRRKHRDAMADQSYLSDASALASLFRDTCLLSVADAAAARLMDIQGTLFSEKMKIHNLHLEVHRELYLAAGELQWRKDCAVERLCDRIRDAEMSLEVAVETLNPEAKQLAATRDQLHKEKKELVEVSQELEELCDGTDKFFSAHSKGPLLEAGREFNDPKVELQRVNDLRREKLVWFQQQMLTDKKSA